MVDTLGTLTAEQKTFYDLKLLTRARKSQVAYIYGKKTNIPKHGGNTANWRRVEAFGLATTPLTEGINPTNTSITLTSVSATALQYGAYSTISDQLDTMGVDDLLAELSVAMGQNGGESVEQLIFNTISGGTNIIYATGTSKANQSASSPLTMSLIRAGVSNINRNNTPRWTGDLEQKTIGAGKYIGFVHPAVAYDMLSDQEIKNAFEYRDNAALYAGSLGMTYQVEWYMSTLCPVYTGQGVSGANVYGTIIVGVDAYGVIDVNGTGKFTMETQEFGSAGTADPLSLQATVGWKAYQAPVILNNNFMVQIISGTAAPGG